MQFYAKKILEQLGVTVHDIPTSRKEESDFLAIFEENKVLIEEKTKFEDTQRLKERQDVLENGEIHVSDMPIIRDNRLSGLVKKAASQLNSSSEQKHDFRLIWFTSTGRDAEAKSLQFVATLYGTTNIVEMNNLQYSKICYFFRNSDFYRYSQIIDGAIVAYLISETDVSVKLCLNPLSPRYNALQSSSVVLKFGSAIEDPVDMEKRGVAFILDGDIDRNDESALFSFLQKKYNTLPLMNIDIGCHTASILVNERSE
jgi:hypothetical protein